jgi:sortase (surface protein transpeptidase)
MTGSRTRPAAAAAAAVLLALVLLAGCGGPDGRYAGSSSPVTTRAPDRPAEGQAAVREFRSVRGYRATPVPVRLEIDRIGVATSLQRLGRARDRTVEVPSEWDVAGWYEDGPRPGDPGSAVVLGHVDSRTGPAVFYRLRELRRGDRIEVVRSDRSRVSFRVDQVSQYDKRRFPTNEVYYPTLRPQLRLVTCGGPFDRASGHYVDNVIVFASLSR